MLKTVATENGLVKGLPGNNTRITVFKGIPYGAPPVGDLRWKAPQSAPSWDGVLEAYSFGPISIQDTPGLGTDIYCREWHVDPDIDMSEDCLYLNVWTNAKSDKDNLPVIVWFFGGAFQWGYPPEMEFNGENIAKRDVVVVSVNYRLGAFGFLAHPELTKENPDAPTNFGLMDQLAGLKWVERNIANFGGDPSNITIAGQSAGGGSVFSHVCSPLSKGHFQKAIIYSGIINFPYFEDKVITPRSISDMEEMGSKLFDMLGVKTLEEARGLDPLKIREVYAEFRMKYGFMVPCVDGKFLEEVPFKAFLAGKHANVPILAGNTTDEFKCFIEAENDEEFEAKAKEIFGDKAKEFLSFKNVYERNQNMYAIADGVECSIKSILGANTQDSYYYLFDPDIPGWDNPGTFHSVDLWFFFETLGMCWRPFKGYHFDLARKMCNYITNFVKNGNPNGYDADGTKMPEWEPYNPASSIGMKFVSSGPESYSDKSEFKKFITDWLTFKNKGVKNQAFNPYLPSWEYVPDGEPYVFNDRVYIYGSHDKFGSSGFCLNDYVCYSAPVSDLSAWRYEGVTYTRLDDPLNKANKMCLYAPDVQVGPDGRYYMYYALDKDCVISVAVCDEPAGRYRFYGYVHYEDGTLLGKKAGDEPQFDPGVLRIDNVTYLFTGFCGRGDKSRHGCMRTVLADDMLTIIKAPEFVIPGCEYSRGTEFENHAFFEAPSIREFDGKYYLIYSSEVMHELCYAISDTIDGTFKYGGVIVSNCDLGIDSYKPADMPTAYGANNHGSLIEIAGKRYIFYHRQTNNSWYCRQVCAEEVTFNPDGSINQAELTSCGLNGGPLSDIPEYPTYIACNLFTNEPNPYIGGYKVPFITMDGKDGDTNIGYIRGITDSATMGFKYFNLSGVKGIELKARGYAWGEFAVKTSIDGPILGKVKVDFSTVWETYTILCDIPDGITPLYIEYIGGGDPELKSFRFLH